MKHPRFLPDEHLRPLTRELLPQDLARIAILMNDLAYMMTTDSGLADRVLNSVSSQMYEQLPEEAAETFRLMMKQAAGSELTRTVAV